MNSNLSGLLSQMIGTVAVILVVAGFVGGSDLFSRFVNTDKKWKFATYAGILGGVFGIYGNISGFDLEGAVVSVRDIGPMIAGFIAGPLAGFIAGLIAGVHRLSMGGITAQACVVATCCIGTITGFLSVRRHDLVSKPLFALAFSALMEVFHLSLVLIMVKPFETAKHIVEQIAAPFISINAIGFMMMMLIITYMEKQRILSAEKSRLESELEVANVIQHSLLPPLSDDYPGCKGLDVGAYMEAAKEVGGDFYDVFYVDSNRIAFVIGDVSGKGVPAALVMASSKTILQNAIREIPKLSKAIETANNTICANNEVEMFVTLWVGIYDTTNQSLCYVNAGHNPPILLRKGKPEYLHNRSGFVLGGMEDCNYNEFNMQFKKGDMLFLYTDGVTEAEDSTHELFGEARLADCFVDEDKCSCAEMIDKVNDAVDEFINGNDQFDDMTMLSFKLE